MLAVFLVGTGFLTRSSLSEEGVVWAHGVRVDTVVHHGGKAWWGETALRCGGNSEAACSYLGQSRNSQQKARASYRSIPSDPLPQSRSVSYHKGPTVCQNSTPGGGFCIHSTTGAESLETVSWFQRAKNINSDRPSFHPDNCEV